MVMPERELLRILVVDDSVFYQKIVKDILAELPYVQVVGTAANGKAALSKIETLQPDLMILDIEMPEMDGLELLARLHAMRTTVGAIMLSTYTREGTLSTFLALELGAFDFIPKPQAGSAEESMAYIRARLFPLLESYSHGLKARKKGGRMVPPGPPARVHRPPLAGIHDRTPVAPFPSRRDRVEVIGIGISTGGPQALASQLPLLPADLGVPILVVQHMPPMFTRALAERLDARCTLTVKEGEDSEVPQSGTVYIAPGGRQMKVVEGNGRRLLRLTDDKEENSCRPSADYLFRSIAQTYGSRAVGVIMTGMGSDGVLGLGLMKRTGATVIAQDEASCVVFGMPKRAIEEGIVDIVAPLEKIATEIIRSVRLPG